MPFVPLQSESSPAGFPRVSPDEQAARDATAEQIVADEFQQDMPGENRKALETEYSQRFNKPPPAVKRGFIPLEKPEQSGPRGFIPLEPERPSVLKTIALENPATAIGEAALNLGSQMVALPVAGLAGLATEAGHAIGITDKRGADVVHQVGEALTYQPRGEFGKAATDLATKPFQALAEVGQKAGGATLDATGSPILATAVDTAINAAPMAIAPAARGSRTLVARGLLNHTDNPSPATLVRLGRFSPEEAQRQYDAWAQSGEANGKITSGNVGNVQRVAPNQEALPRSDGQGLPELRRPGRDDLPGVAEQLQDVPAGRGTEAGTGSAAMAGSVGSERALPAGERRLGEPPAADIAPEVLPSSGSERAITDNRGSGATDRPSASDLSSSNPEPTSLGASHDAGAPTLPKGFIPLDAQRANLELTGVGGDLGRPGADTARATAERQSQRAGRRAAAATDPVAEDLSRADRVLKNTGEITGYVDYYNRHVADGKQIEGMTRHPDGGYTFSVRDHGEPATATLSAARVPDFISMLRDPVKVREIEARNHADTVLGRSVREADDVTLRKWADMESLGDVPRAKAMRELKRRQAEHEPSVLAMQVDAAAYQAATSPLKDKPVIADRIAGKVLTEFDDAAKTRARAELERRATDPETLNAWAPGANYVPMVDQVRAPSSKAQTVADLPAPKRREKIIADLAKALDSTVYEGRVKGKHLGFFRPKIEEVRIKNAADIEVAGHELAHLMDFRIPELRKAWQSDKALAAELRSVSYDLKDVREGFAEGVRLWMTQPETLEAKAPKVFQWLNDFADQHAYGPALRKAQEQMTEWFGQDALNRARSKIGSEKPLAEFFDRFWDKFRQSTVDDLHGIYNMERSLKGGKIEPIGAYESARLARASASIADGAVRFGYPVKKPDGSFTWKGKGLEEILKPVAESMDDALLYFVGKSSAELMSQGREHLFTKGEIQAMLKLRTPEREAAFQDYQAWNKGILDFAEAQGVINPESRRLWQRTQYLPFHRVGQAGGVKGKPGDWAGIQALTGGTTNIKDVLGNMIGNAAMLLDKAVKNEARLKVADMADKIEGAGKFMVKIDAESRPVKISGDQVLDAMFKRYGIGIEGDAPAFFEFLIKGQPPAGNNVVAVLRGGKPTWYEVGDPILYRALQAIDRQPMQWLVKLLGMPKRIGQTTITLTPDFMIANIARDTIMGAVMSRAGFRPIVDSLNGMRLRLTNDPIYKDYIANGGGLSSIYLDETALLTKLEKFYGRQGIDYRTVLDTPSKMLHGLETIADAFEMSTRLGEYKRAIDRGENPRHAAYLGRDVSTDFAMRGDSKALGVLYDTVMFLRPAVVSLDRLARGVAHDPNKGAIAAKAGMIALASASLYLMNKDDPRYADLPDWDRDANWHIFVGEHHFRYPKIWETGALASAAERTAEKIIAADPAGLGKDFARILAATFNWNLTPQIAAPLIEQATNRNSFTHAPIETPGMEGVQPFLRAKPGTSETMKAAGMLTRDLPEAVQVNPVRAEALLRGYFNTYAMYGLMLTDKAFFSDKLPERRTDELPVLRRFYANEPAKHTKYESEFYDMLQEAKRLRGTMKELDSMGLKNYADDKEQSPLATEAKPLERAAKNLSGINKDMEAVRNDGNLSPAEKRAKLDSLTVERNALLKAAVTDSKAAQKGNQQ